jgi:hypothetical protein
MADRKTPKFTKRDFQWIADQCKDHWEYLKYEGEEQKYTLFERELLDYFHWKFVQGLSKELSRTNGAYQRDKFIRAAVPEEFRDRWYLGVVPNPVKQEA